MLNILYFLLFVIFLVYIFWTKQKQKEKEVETQLENKIKEKEIEIKKLDEEITKLNRQRVILNTLSGIEGVFTPMLEEWLYSFCDTISFQIQFVSKPHRDKAIFRYVSMTDDAIVVECWEGNKQNYAVLYIGVAQHVMRYYNLWNDYDMIINCNNYVNHVVAFAQVMIWKALGEAEWALCFENYPGMEKDMMDELKKAIHHEPCKIDKFTTYVAFIEQFSKK